jgi:protein involved in temperature-dependent protein secretion
MEAKSRNSVKLPKAPSRQLKRFNYTNLLRLFLLIFAMIFLSRLSFGQGVGISESTIIPDASAILELKSKERGFLVPRINTVQRDAITSPANGLIIYNIDQEKLNIYDASVPTWRIIFSVKAFQNNLAVSTDANGELVNAVDGQDFNVNSDVIKLGDGVGTEQITATGNIDATGGLDVTGADLTVGSTTIDPATGDADIAGTLNADEATTLGSTLAVTGNTTLDEDVILGDANDDEITANGNLNALDGLDVSGADLTVATNTSITGNLTVSGNSTLGDEDGDVIGIRGVTTVTGTSTDLSATATNLNSTTTTVADGTTFTVNSNAINIGNAETDAVDINGTIQEGSLIAGTNALVLDGSTADVTNRTTIAVSDPTQPNTITLPNKSGTVVLQGIGNYTGDLALTTDASGNIVEAENGQDFNVNSDLVNIGNAVDDAINIQGATTVTGNSTSLDATATSINSATIGIGNDLTDDITATGNLTVADGATTTAINANTIKLGNADDDAITLQGNNTITGDGLTVTTAQTDLNSATTNVTGAAINIGDANDDAVAIQGAVGVSGNSLGITSSTLTVDDATTTAINSDVLSLGNENDDVIGIQGATTVHGNSLTVVSGETNLNSATTNITGANINIGNAETDAVDINGTIQEGSLIAGTNALVLDGSTADVTNRTTIAVSDPTQPNTITLPNKSGTVVLQGIGNYTGDLALTTDASGNIVEAENGQDFNVNSDLVNIGNAVDDAINIQGATTVTGNSTSLDATATSINSATIGIGNDLTDDITATGNLTVADGATTTAINANTIKLGNADDDAITLQGNNTITGDGLTVTTAQTDLNSATTNVTGAAINIGDANDDAVAIQGAVGVSGNSLGITSSTLTVDDATTTAINSDVLSLGNENDDVIGIQGATTVHGNSLTVVSGETNLNSATTNITGANINIGNAETDAVDINGTIQEGSLIAGTNALVLDGSTADVTNRTTIAVSDPTQPNTITLPNKSGTVVLQGIGNYTGDLALTTDASGNIVEAENGQDFNVNSDLVNIGNAVDDAINIQGATTVTGNSTSLDATATSINSATIGIGNDLTDDITATGNLTVADGATTTAINANTIKLGNADDDAITLQGNNTITGDGLTVTTAQTDLNSATTNVTGAAINIGDANDDAVAIQGAVGVSGNSLGITSSTLTVDDATTTAINSDVLSLGNENDDVIGIQGATTVHGNSLTVVSGETNLNSATTNITGANINIGNAETDAVDINGTIQEGSLIAGTNALVLDGSTADVTNRTTIAVSDPTQPNTITLPNKSGTVVLQGIGNYTGDLALTTDASGNIVEAENGQDFNVNSDLVNIGNAVDDAINIQGATTVTGNSTSLDATATSINSATIGIGNDLTDDITATGNLTVADGATTTAINANTIKLGNADDDAITLQGNNTITGDGLTVTTAQTDLNSATTNVTGAAINIGDANDDAVAIQGAVGVSGNSLGITSSTLTVDDATTTAINSDVLSLGNENDDVIGIQGATTVHGNSLTVVSGETNLNSATTNITGANINIGNAETDAVDINGTIQEGSLIAGTNALVLDGSTADVTNRTTIAVSDPTQPNTITLPNKSGTVVLQGIGNYTGDLALTTDASGNIVEAENGQDFNVNSDLVNIGNAVDDAINIQGATTVTGNSTSLDATATSINSATIGIGNDLTDDITATGNLTVADGATTTAINANTIKLGNADDDAITLQGNNTITGDGLTVTTAQTDLNSATTNVTGAAINIGDANDDAVAIQGAVGVSGNSLGITSSTLTVDDATTTAINSDVLSLGNENDDVIGIQGATTVHGNSLTVVSGETNLNSATTNITGANINIGNAETDAVDINGTIQEGSLIAGTNALVLDGSTADVTNRTTIAVSDPTQPNTITLPNKSGTVVLQGIGNYTGDLALTTDASGNIVEAENGQDFNVNSDLVNIGNAVDDAINIQGATTVTGNSTSLDATATSINSATIGIGNDLTDDITATGNLTVADGATTTAINANTIKLGNADDDAITLQGNNTITGDGLTVTTAQTDLNSATTNVTGAAINIGDDAADAVAISGTLQGSNPLVFNAGNNTTTFAIDATGTDKTITFPNESGTVALVGGNGLNMQVFTSSTTWIVPAGITKVHVKVWGGGGAGASGVSVTGGGSGGGGGAYSEGIISVSGSVIVTVGNGGASNGANGTASSFAGVTTVSANGGMGGTVGAAGGAGGTIGTGTVQVAGGSGGTGGSGDDSFGGIGGNSPFGGGGGGGGGNGNTAYNGVTGTFPGGGGGGGNEAGGTFGVGAGGLVIIYW